MEKKVTIIYGEINEAFGGVIQAYVIKVNENDAEALKEILTRNGYGIVNF